MTLIAHLLTVTDNAHGLAGIDCVGVDFTAHNRSGADHTSIAQDRAIEQYAVGANPDIVFNQNATLTGQESLLTDRSIAVMIGMIDWRERAIGGDRHLVADPDAVSGIQNTTGVDDSPRSNLNVAAAPGRLELHEAIDHRVRTNLNARATD